MNLHSIVSHPRVRTARAAIHSRDRETVEEQIRLVSIPAPTGAETDRARYVRRRFDELGLERTRVDEVGNVLGYLGPPRRGNVVPGPVLLTAHLDTIFPEGTPIEPRREGTRI